jgi:AcrR family transcriptional regulator
MKLDRSTLLEAALQVFAEKGLEGASMRAIARAANCDASLLYYYFENKEAVFSAVLDQRLPALVAALRKLASPGDRRSSAEKLWTMLQLFHRHGADRGFRGLMRAQLDKGAEGLSDLVARKVIPAQVAMRTIVRRGQRAGEIRPELETRLVVMFLIRMEAELLNLVPGYSMIMIGMEPDRALAEAERSWFDVFWRGIATDPLAPLPFLEAQPS